MPRHAVVRAVLNLGLAEFTHRWGVVYYNLAEELERLKRLRQPITDPTPLDEEVARVQAVSEPLT